MKMVLKIEKYHSLIFTIISLLGLELCLSLRNISISTFIIFSVIFLFIFTIEAFMSFRLGLRLQSKLALPHIIEEVKRIHITQHIILPLLLYVELIFFIFFNNTGLEPQAFIIIGSITFFSIFEGQRKTFINEFLFNETLHYIYDSIKIIIYFLGVEIITQSTTYFELNIIYSILLIQGLSFTLFLLILLRKDQYSNPASIYIFASSTIIALITVLSLNIINSPLIIALLSTVFFYILVGFMHHKINATLKASVILEYAAIALIIILAIKGIS